MLQRPIREPSRNSEPSSGETRSQGSEEPVLCRHCGRTASNGICCEGACVADSGY